MKLQELILEATNQLTQAKVTFGHGTNNAHDEASWLVLWSLGMTLDTDTTLSNPELSGPQLERARSLIEDRITKRLPSAYLLGKLGYKGSHFLWINAVLFPVV